MDTRRVLDICVLFQCILDVVAGRVLSHKRDLDDIIDLDHEYLTYDSYHDNDDIIDTMQYYFRPDRAQDYLPLYRNPHIDLNSPLCFLEGKKVVCEYGEVKGHHFYHDGNHSVAVAISNKNGTIRLNGVALSEDGMYEFQPEESRDKINDHVIRKRWTANVVHRRKYEPRRAPLHSVRQYNRQPRKPFRNQETGNCVDILCVIDYSVYKKFKAEEKTEQAAMAKVRYYYAHVINGINMRYSSIAQKELKLNIRLAGYFVAKTPTDLPFIKANKLSRHTRYRMNSRSTLESLDKFLDSVDGKKNLPDYNHAMLFLEYTSASQGGSILGTSFVNGICDASKSTSLVVDHGAYTSAGIGCHELGHNLGVQWHDGEGRLADSASCNSSHNYIMAPASYLIDETNLKYSFSFSQCSIDQIKTNIERLTYRSRNCLPCNKRSPTVGVDTNTYLDKLPGESQSVHEQCRQLYGEGSFMCPPKSANELCYRMYCYDPRRSACAIISEQMAVPGTPCGNMKICSMGKCVRSKRGQDVADDCPYPDIPSTGARCEDAVPYMCKNERFKQKCCQSCSQKFTAEGSCKDVHIKINGLTCPQLMTTMQGTIGCQASYEVQNICCQSCKALMARGGGHRFMGNLGIQLGVRPGRTRRRQWVSSRTIIPTIQSSTRQRSVTNAVTTTRRAQNAVVVNRKSRKKPPTSCRDSTTIKINSMDCPTLVYTLKHRACANIQMKRICCLSCWKLVYG